MSQEEFAKQLQEIIDNVNAQRNGPYTTESALELIKKLILET